MNHKFNSKVFKLENDFQEFRENGRLEEQITDMQDQIDELRKKVGILENHIINEWKLTKTIYLIIKKQL